MGMINRRFSKYKGLFLSVTGFFVFFLIYLLANTAIQNSAFKEQQYAGVLREASDAIVAASDVNDTLVLLQKVQTGGEFRLHSGAVLTFTAIDDYLAPQRGNVAQIIQALKAPDFALSHRLMSSLTNKVDAKVARKLKLAHTLQLVAAVLTVILYFMVLIPVLLRINKTDELAQQSRKETEGILKTVSEGLFLLGKDHQIGVQQSASLRQMFKRDRDLEGDFFDFIGQYVTPSTVQIAKDYMALLFGDRVKERLVEDLNPLKAVEIGIIRRDGRYENRYLDFKFKRIFLDGKINHVLGSVSDITRQVELEKELAETQSQQEAQLSLLMRILHIDREQLMLFFRQTEKTLRSINSRFERDSDHELTLRNNLVKIARDAHRLKGDAAALGLTNFENLAHGLEDEVAKVKRLSGKISGNDLLDIVSKLRELFTELGNMKTLLEKFSESFGDSVDLPATASATVVVDKPKPAQMQPRRRAARAGGQAVLPAAVTKAQQKPEVEFELATRFNQLVATVAKRNGVEARLESKGLSSTTIPPHLLTAVNDIVVQLLRNSVVHGAETPQAREAKGKPAWLNINAHFIEKDNGYELVVRDDGRGISPERIIARAIDLNMITASAAQKLEPKRAIALMFMSGFTSAEKTSLDGGRGIGLDVVKDLVKRHNGKVGVQFETGAYSQFRFAFPKVA